MSPWRERFETGAGYALSGVLAALLVYAVVRGWIEEQPSRYLTTGGLVALAVALGLLWGRLALWSRAALLATYPVVLIGGLALYYTARDSASFWLGPLRLVELVNGLILLGLALAAWIAWRVPRLHRRVRIGITVISALCAYPFVFGLIRGVAMPDLISGDALPFDVPLPLRPSVVGVVVLLPALVAWLAFELFGSLRRGQGSPFRRALALVAVAVPTAVGLVAVLSVEQRGLARRTFLAHDYQSLGTQGIEPAPSLEWSVPPRGASDGSFWVEWEGRLRVPQDGVRQFRLEGEGDGFLYLDGKLAIARGQRDGQLELPAGSYRLRIGAVQSHAAGDFRLLWKRQEDAEFEPIPVDVLSHRPAESSWRRSPRQAAQVGIDWLQSAAVAWQRSHACFGCHVQAQALMGLSIAERNQYQVNRDYYDELHEFTRTQQREDGAYHGDVQTVATQYAAMALAYVDAHRGIDPDPVLTKAVDWLLERQDSSGVIPNDHNLAPIDQGSIMTTANGTVALDRLLETDGGQRLDEARARAVVWLEAAEPETTQDVIQKILGLARRGDPRHQPILAALVARLREEQESDGGWRETPQMGGSNAYATGEVLYALKQAGVSVNDPAFERGVLYLLETQKVTGSWSAVHTQGQGTEFAPTMWAVIGLAGSFGAIVPELEVDGACGLVSGELDLRARVTNYTDAPIQSVAFEVDSMPLEPVRREGAAEVYASRWNSDASPEGAHTLRVVATNQSGESGEDTATLYTGRPFGIAITSPGDSVSVEQEVVCRAEVTNSAGLPIESVEFFLDGAAMPLATARSEPWEAPCDFSEAAQGGHRLHAVVTGCGKTARDELLLAVGPEEGPGLLQVRLRTEGEQLLYIPPGNIELVLDMSGSMWGQLEGVTKYEIARDVLTRVLAQVPAESNLALRVYGHRHKARCDDSELLIPPGPLDAAAVNARVASLRPKGKTPIDLSLREIASDLQGIEASKAVVLITDGVETCGGDPADAARALVEAGVGVRVHVVGFDVGDAPDAVQQLQQVAEFGKGKFFLAQNADELADALIEAVQLNYTVYDTGNSAVFSRPLGPEEQRIMSGTYRIEIDLAPPLVLDGVEIRKGATTHLELVKEGDGFRIERAGG